MMYKTVQFLSKTSIGQRLFISCTHSFNNNLSEDILDMDIKLNVSFNQKSMDIQKALENSLVLVAHNCIIPQENVRLNISTLLYDQNDCEIFENDIVCDSSGKKFQIIYQDGAFFAARAGTNTDNSILPLHLLQLNGHIPVTKCKEST